MSASSAAQRPDDHLPRDHRPRDHRPVELRPVDVVIIGAGVIGVSIALEAQRRGLRSAVVDRGPEPGAGSTSTSPGIIRFHAADRQAAVVALEGYRCYVEWNDHLGVPRAAPAARFECTGSLLLDGPEDYATRAHEVMTSLGLVTEVLDEGELRREFPWMSTARYSRSATAGPGRSGPRTPLHGVFSPGAGIVRTPALVTRDLARAFASGGGRFLLTRTVTEVLVRHDHVVGVRLDCGEELSAPVVVNAAGPHSDRMNEVAHVTGDMSIRTRPLRHQMHRALSPEGVDFERIGCHVSDGDLELNFWPDGSGMIAAGLESSDAGNLALADPDSPEATSRECAVEATRRLALRVPGTVVPRPGSGWSGLFDVSDDWTPVYDRSCLDGFYMAVGTSGNQFKAAPVVGHLLTELILHCESANDHDARPLVVQGPRTGEPIDLGRYSRRRTATTGTGSLNG